MSDQATHAEEAIPEKTWPDEWRDGARCGLLQKYEGERERGGYPKGFHQWPLDRRNAWFAGFNVGFHDRLRLTAEIAR